MTLVFRFHPLRAAQAAARLVSLAGGRLNRTRLSELLYLLDRRGLIETGSPLTGASLANGRRGPQLIGFDQSVAWGQCFRCEGDDVVLVAAAGDGELSEYDVEVLEALHSAPARDLRELPEWRDPSPEDVRPLTYSIVLEASGATRETIEGYESLNAAVRALDDCRVVRDRLPTDVRPDPSAG